jgi:hypothetical protein
MIVSVVVVIVVVADGTKTVVSVSVTVMAAVGLAAANVVVTVLVSAAQLCPGAGQTSQRTFCSTRSPKLFGEAPISRPARTDRFASGTTGALPPRPAYVAPGRVSWTGVKPSGAAMTVDVDVVVVSVDVVSSVSVVTAVCVMVLASV